MAVLSKLVQTNSTTAAILYSDDRRVMMTICAGNFTRIKRDGAKIPYTNDQHSFNFNRMYDASNKDITLQLWFENSAYNTYLGGFRGTITITALD